MRKPSFYEKYIKRLLDIIFSLAGIIILSPVLIITAILVRIKLGSPVIFTQVRPGKDEKLFKMYKFRTMTDERDENGELLPFNERLTSFGKILRKLSIDELPSLFNVMKGDLSIVGPRPLLKSYLPYYDTNQRKRHLVRPGITGLAQVSGRNYLDWDDRFNLDLDYIKNINFSGDINIILKTIKKAITSEGVAIHNHKMLNFDDYALEKLNPYKLNKKDFILYRDNIIDLLDYDKRKKCNKNDIFDIYEKMLNYVVVDQTIVYSYILNGKIIAIIQFFTYKENMVDYVHINRLVVEEKHRGKKIGQRLIKFVREQYPNSKVTLHVKKNNFKALNLYKKNGFIYGKDSKGDYYNMIHEGEI